MIISKLINTFSGINTVIIDGDVRTKTLDKIISQLNKKRPRIITEPKADKNYRLVNAADRIAYRLFLCYSRNVGVEHKTDYERHLIREPIIQKAA